jgi:RNA polymerase sporulation-specific sigma factor
MHDVDLILNQYVKKAKLGDENAFENILKILDPEIKKIANKYYIIGSDDQDVIQECRIGIFKAVKDFDESMGMTFKNFSLSLCCKRHLITAMSHANTQKFKLQNEAVSLSAPVSQNEEDGIQTYADYIPDENNDPLNSYIIKEEFNTNLALIEDKLTKLEVSILHRYAVDTSYKAIADGLGVKAKTVDNGLMRIRKKCFETYQFYLNTHAIINIGSSIETCGFSITSFTSSVTTFFTNYYIGTATGVCSNMAFANVY